MSALGMVVGSLLPNLTRRAIMLVHKMAGMVVILLSQLCHIIVNDVM